MANVLYASFKQLLLGGDIDLENHDIKVVLVDTADYTYSAAHDFLDDVPAGARVATSSNLGSKTITSGVFDAADVTFSTVTGDQSEALIIYRDTGVASTSPLIAYIDTATGLPVTPNGGNITVSWDSGASKIFAL
jgi:hypothetical protein